MNFSLVPEWSDLFKKSQDVSLDLAWGDREKPKFLLAKSALSIKVIIEWYFKRVTGKQTLNFWVPDYFCNETLEYFSHDPRIRLIFYPINRNLEPKWDICKDYSELNKPDIFLYTHYFGRIGKIDQARVFCDNKQAILIEDCAHFLYSNGKIGRLGDFVLFSPHKCVALPDGAVLSVNIDTKFFIKTDIDNELSLIRNCILQMKGENDISLWLVKRYIQKITRIKRKEKLLYEIHWGGTDPIGSEFQVSKFTQRNIKKYSYTVLKAYGRIRWKNLEVMNYLLKNEDPAIVPLSFESTSIPYYAVFSLDKVSNKQQFLDRLANKRYIVRSWPDLPKQLYTEINNHEDAINLSRDIITLPIHQGLNPQGLLKKYSSSTNDVHINAEALLEFSIVDRYRWTCLYSQIEKSTITQDWAYGDAKASVEGWDVLRGVLKVGSTEIGLVQVLIKKILGIPCIVRINRGPIFFPGYDTIENWEDSILMLKRNFGLHNLKILSIVPEKTNSPMALDFMTKNHFIKMKRPNWESSWINLQLSEDNLRNSLKSKWRNQLKNAEKRNLLLEEWDNDLEPLLYLYQESMKERAYQGISIDLLRYLHKNEEQSLLTMVVYGQDQDLIGFDIIYLHGSSATYLVGWENDIGRRNYVNNLLLFEILVLLKKRNFKFFDTGGIDAIHTEEIAHFKNGLGGTDYELLGDFFQV